MSNDPNEPASDFLSPSGWIRAAQRAHPAFKFAIVVGGLAGVVVTFTRFGASPATLVFGIVIVVVLMVLFLVFAQAARLRRHKLSFASLFLVWSFLCLSVGTALLLFTSTFFNGPLPFHDYIVRSMGLTSQPKGEANQRELEPQTSSQSPELPKGYFSIQSHATDLFMDMNYVEGERDVRLTESVYNRDKKSQKWKWLPTSDERYVYLTTKDSIDKNSNQCLEIIPANPDRQQPDVAAIRNGQQLGLGTIRNVKTQQWKVIAVKPGCWLITSALNGMAIDVPNAQEIDGLPLIMWGKQGSDNQLWRLKPL
jgi:energy-coupling factor transporter transmembrane protein EcfT